MKGNEKMTCDSCTYFQDCEKRKSILELETRTNPFPSSQTYQSSKDCEQYKEDEETKRLRQFMKESDERFDELFKKHKPGDGISDALIEAANYLKNFSKEEEKKEKKFLEEHNEFERK